MENVDYEWRPYRVAFPRLGLLVSRDGVKTSLIWPGLYLVRRSRSLSRWVYRRRPAEMKG
jgi:hypothetical protein